MVPITEVLFHVIASNLAESYKIFHCMSLYTIILLLVIVKFSTLGEQSYVIDMLKLFISNVSEFSEHI